MTNEENIAIVFINTLKRPDLSVKDLLALDEIWEGLSNEEKKVINEKLDDTFYKKILT